MSTNTAADHNRTGRESALGVVATDLLRIFGSSCIIGTDAEEYQHHYYSAADMVVVFDGRDLCGAFSLKPCGDGTLVDWINHVSAVRGWSSRSSDWRVAVEYDRRKKGVR